MYRLFTQLCQHRAQSCAGKSMNLDPLVDINIYRDIGLILDDAELYLRPRPCRDHTGLHKITRVTTLQESRTYRTRRNALNFLQFRTSKNHIERLREMSRGCNISSIFIHSFLLYQSFFDRFCFNKLICRTYTYARIFFRISFFK